MSIILSKQEKQEPKIEENNKENNQPAEVKKEKQENNSNASAMDKINIFLARFSRVPLKEKLFFVQYLGIMLKAGISLSAALKTLAKQTANKRFSLIINDIANNVEKGSTLTESLTPHKNVFGELFINMIEAGEISGKLEDVLTQLYIQLKKQHELTSKITVLIVEVAAGANFKIS